MRGMRAVVVPVMFAALLAGGPSAHAAYPGGNGMLGFVNSLGGWSKDFSLLRVNPDGSGLNDLVPPMADVSINNNPEWSPDGNHVVYERFRPWGGAIYRANADGGGETLLTPEGVVAGRPTWSPDGTRIAYRRYSTSNTADASLWVMNADGGGQHEAIPDEVGEGKCSAWLSEMDWGVGDRIAFVAACTSGATQGWRLWTAKGDGTDLQPVSGVPEGLATNASGLDFSPDGKRLVLSSWDTQYPDESLTGGCGPTINAMDLFVVDVEANTVTKLTATSGRDGPHEVDPAWSPDGTRIAYSANTLTCSGGVFTFHPARLYTIAANGTDVRAVSDPQPGTGDGPYGEYTIDTNDTVPDWQPCIAGVTSVCTTATPPRGTAPPTDGGSPSPSAGAGTAPSAVAVHGHVSAATVIGLPATRRCVSRRALTIHLHRPDGERLRKVTTTVGDGRPHSVTRNLTAPIVLRGLPKGRWTVHVVVTTDRGTYRLTRRYRTCTARRRGATRRS